MDPRQHPVAHRQRQVLPHPGRHVGVHPAQQPTGQRQDHVQHRDTQQRPEGHRDQHIVDDPLEQPDLGGLHRRKGDGHEQQHHDPGPERTQLRTQASQDVAHGNPRRRSDQPVALCLGRQERHHPAAGSRERPRPRELAGTAHGMPARHQLAQVRARRRGRFLDFFFVTELQSRLEQPAFVRAAGVSARNNPDLAMIPPSKPARHGARPCRHHAAHRAWHADETRVRKLSRSTNRPTRPRGNTPGPTRGMRAAWAPGHGRCRVRGTRNVDCVVT